MKLFEYIYCHNPECNIRFIRINPLNFYHNEKCKSHHYYITHKQQKKYTSHRYYQLHKQNSYIKNLIWRKNNKEKIKEYRLKYNLLHRDLNNIKAKTHYFNKKHGTHWRFAGFANLKFTKNNEAYTYI